MAKGKKEQVTIIVSHGRGPIDCAMFRKAIDGHLGALYAISEAASKGNRKPVGWEIVKVSMASPFRMTVRPKTVRGSALIGAYKRGLTRLQRSATRPKYFGDDALVHARRLAQSVNGNGDVITIESKKYGSIRISSQIAQHIDAIEENEGFQPDSRQQHYEWNTLRGRLYEIDAWGALSFEIRDLLTNKKVRCKFGGESVEQIQAALMKRVAVYGRVKYNDKGEPTHISVDEMRVLDDSLYDFDSKKKIDIGGGIDSMTHVERVRNGT